MAAEAGSDAGTVISIFAALSPIFLALLAGLGWLYRHERERREEIERQLSEEKYKAYIALIETFFGMLKAQALGRKPPAQTDLIERMFDANQQLILYGSDDVVRIYQTFLHEARNQVVDMQRFGELIVAIRRDMGNAATKITSEDVLRQLITDFDQAKERGELRRTITD